MSTTASTHVLKDKSAGRLVEYLKHCYSFMDHQWDLRARMEQIDRQYQREVDFTEEQAKAKAANRRGDPTKIQNIIVPVILPQVESIVTYQASVFLTGYPIFGTVAGPTNAEAAQQMDTILGEQQIRGGWIAELTKAIRDGAKYNLLAAEAKWTRKTVPTDEAGGTKLLWQGNTLRRMDLYNTFWDIRCAPSKVAEQGEFQGYHELYSRIAFKKFLHDTPGVFNVTAALESSCTPVGTTGSSVGISGYYVPCINPEAFLNTEKLSGFNWASFFDLDPSHRQSKHRENIAYKDIYQVTTLYAKILPSDFGITGVPGPNIPQNWMFIVVNNQVLIYAERLSTAHPYLPIQFAQLLDDGLSYQTKSVAQNVAPIQEIVSSLANLDLASKRRAVGDRLLYDQSRINPAHIKSDSPVARIPVKPGAFGKGLGDAIYPVPFNDATLQSALQNIGMYESLANKISGLNPTRQGQFVKGNKTRAEFDATMVNSNGRDQLMAMTLEATFFTPTKEILKANILQYQSGVTLYNRETKEPVEVDPVKLQKAMIEFKMSDGLIPGEKLASADSLAVAFQTLQAVPGLAQQYNLGPMFSYLMKIQGAQIDSFEKSPEQLEYEQAVQAWSQSVMQLAQTIQSDNSLTPEQKQQAIQSLPPQPTPEQYGYNPQAKVRQSAGASTANGGSVLASFVSEG